MGAEGPHSHILTTALQLLAPNLKDGEHQRATSTLTPPPSSLL